MRRPIFGLRFWSALVLTLTGYAPVHGATISGVVMDAGVAVDDAEMVLIEADNNVVLAKTHTGAGGDFRFTVDSGTFNVVAFKSDYVTRWTRGITVGADDVSIRVELESKAFTNNYSGAADDGCI